MRVLAAIDLDGEGHEQVAHFARSAAQRLGATVDLLNVHRVDDDPERLQARRDGLQALIDAFPPAQQGEVRCEGGGPVDRIIALSEPYDALVVGPRSRTTWERLFLGTVAAQVVRKAKCPVLVCRGEPLPDTPRLLVGLDLRRTTHERLTERASRWVTLFGGTLDAVYIDTHRVPLIRDATVRRAALSEQESRRERQRRLLERIVAQVPPDHRGQVAVVEGAGPGEKLVEMSESYDLLVVGSLERQGVVQHLLGSVAEFVVSRAKSNVLTFPAQLE